MPTPPPPPPTRLTRFAVGGCNCCQCLPCALSAGFTVTYSDTGGLSGSGTVPSVGTSTTFTNAGGGTPTYGCAAFDNTLGAHPGFPVYNGATLVGYMGIQVVCGINSGAGGPDTEYYFSYFYPGGGWTGSAWYYPNALPGATMSLPSPSCSPLNLPFQWTNGAGAFKYWTFTP